MSSTSQSVPPDIAAVVLAAGYSSRMGGFKPLLQLDGVTALERSIRLFHQAGVEEVIAVLGHRAGDLRPIAERCGARCVYNARFQDGMYSSIVAGVGALPATARAVLELPVDIPLVRPDTVRALMWEFARQGGDIVYPVFGGFRGHPPLIAQPVLSEIASGAPGPLRAVLAAHQSRAVEVPVADQAIGMDMDTPADYEALQALAGRRDIPTESECEAILSLHGVPRVVVMHVHMVTRVARVLASALANRGAGLNLELVQASALLHDLAKGQPSHAAAGAAILDAMGFPEVARIVAAHSEAPVPIRVDESALVFLADKLVCGGSIVTLQERFAPALERFAHQPEALEAAKRRLHAARAVEAEVESRLGRTVAEVLAPCPAVAQLESGAPIAVKLGDDDGE